jgi:hypothetical protein
MKGVSGGYSIIVNEDVGPGSAWVWICILKDLHVADPDAFNERTLRLFPTHSRNPSDIIAGQIARARAEGVAQDAVYWFDGRWFYAADIRSEDTRAALKLPLEQEVMSDE